MNERIKKIRQVFNLTQQQFADKIGIKRNTVANYETGRNEPIDGVVSLICREFNINDEWLRNGTGEMLVEETTDEKIAAFIGDVQKEEEGSFKKRLLAVMANLTEDQWEVLAEIATKFAQEKD